MSDHYLVISDLQIPFHNTQAFDFCRYLKRHYRIPEENILNVGDETDQYFGGLWKRSPNATHTAKSEIASAKVELKRWYEEFPKMRLATSNHGLRWARKAFEAEIPEECMRSYRELIEAPPGWRWQDRWVIKASKAPFLLIHGMEYGGVSAYRQAPLTEGISVVFGHLHANAGIAYIRTANQSIWGFNTGCLIDPDSYAFEYGKWNKFKPALGAGIIFSGGTMPVWYPINA